MRRRIVSNILCCFELSVDFVLSSNHQEIAGSMRYSESSVVIAISFNASILAASLRYFRAFEMLSFSFISPKVFKTICGGYSPIIKTKAIDLT